MGSGGDSKVREALVVTGADSSHFDLVEDFILSFREMYKDKARVAFINFCGSPVSAVISKNFHSIITCSEGFSNFDRKQGYFAAYNRIKPRLPELFSGYRYYCWIDADCWFHTPDSLRRIIEFSDAYDVCIHPENDIHYWRQPTPTRRTIRIYERNERANFEMMPVNMPMLNAGVFAMSSGSRLWNEWDQELASLRKRFEAGEDIYFSDQIPLHKIVHMKAMRIFPLLAIDNWQTYASQPVIRIDKKTKRATLHPATPPDDQIGVIHLAGRTKDMFLKTPEGFEYSLRYRDVKRLSKFYEEAWRRN